MEIGIFVNTDDGSGVGKLVAVNEKVGTVSFFHSITRREEKEYPLYELTRTYLYPHTRVYVQIEENYWRIGRIIGWEKKESEILEYDVQFPNKRIKYYSETDLEVRCLKPLSDPTEILAVGGIETQFFHDKRKQVMDMLIGLRAASQSMTALLSSVIELVPHQVEVVRRVLEDPLQRYLLADEVGMGKAIEAGVIIRQCLLDNPSSQVAIIVPPHLVSQWQQELADKFRISHFSSPVLVLPYAKATKIKTQSIDLLVIDEAHHVVSQTEGVEISEEVRQLIKKQALASKRLLLLSAMPILGHEEMMFAMLNLLDENTYRLNDLATFKEKVLKRQEYGRLLLNLRSETDNSVLCQHVEQANELFADDAIATDLAEKFIASVQNNNTEQTPQICHQLRSYIAETYRIDHRVIRTRRSDTQGWEFMPRGPQIEKGQPINLSHIRVEIDEDERLPALIKLLEQWREVSKSDLANEPTEEIQRARRYVRLFEALGSGADQLAQTLKLDETQSFSGEIEIKAAMRTILAEPKGKFDRYAVAIQCLIQLRKVLQQKKPNSLIKIVVFSSFTTDAQYLYQRLITELDDESEVCTLLTKSELSDQSAAYQFASDKRAWVLICDRHGEEGQNLHFADAILHLDIPFSPARLEQRIGRLDRFGRTQSMIRHRILLPSEENDSPWLAWYELLANGFQLFNRSVSDVQILLEKIEEKLILQFYRLGVQGLNDILDEVKSQLETERKQLDEQHALEQVAKQEGQTLFEAIEIAEEDEEVIKQAVNAWLLDVLKLNFSSKSQNKEPFTLRWDRRTMIPREPWHSLFKPSLETPLAYRRNIAVRQQDVDLIRGGSPLIETLEQLLRWDDRGTVFATWRMNSAWMGQDTIWMGFRLCYIVQADLQPLKEVLLENESLFGLQRRADGFLPPWTTTLLMDSHLEEVSNLAISSVLERPYSNKMSQAISQDFNLGSRLDALHNVIEPTVFKDLCQQVRDSSEHRLRESAAFQERLTKAITATRTELEHQNECLKQRQKVQQRESGLTDTPNVDHELTLNKMLLQGIEKPLIRLDTIGFFVVAGSLPNNQKLSQKLRIGN
ncbi:protein DpdE [Candidatus Parabeggiatoa sp. HSG14]|uniref:protein DpdE n=1 Tax=Candidatus Parabeggiatoa sp. HSG14 TaxID=3055593 RepID=UPI0025A8DB0D|nr:protein DpdE [Thiotrichales bacterium HSG14]